VEEYTQEISGINIISLEGSIDALNANKIEQELISQINSSSARLILNLSKVNFLSSAGLRIILQVLKETRSQGGDLRIACAQSSVLKSLDLSGFTTILKYFPTLDEAILSFSE
jgi:stage II sporulation protein AA (anti-sigma F factor antagonist)